MEIEDIRNYIFTLCGKDNIINICQVCKLWASSFSPNSTIWVDVVKYNYHSEVYRHKPKDISYYQQFKDLINARDISFLDLSNQRVRNKCRSATHKYIYNKDSMGAKIVHRLDIVLHKYYKNPRLLTDILVESCRWDCADNISYFHSIKFGGNEKFYSLIIIRIIVEDIDWLDSFRLLILVCGVFNSLKTLQVLKDIHSSMISNLKAGVYDKKCLGECFLGEQTILVSSFH